MSEGKSPLFFVLLASWELLGWGPQRLGRWGVSREPGATLGEKLHSPSRPL